MSDPKKMSLPKKPKPRHPPYGELLTFVEGCLMEAMTEAGFIYRGFRQPTDRAIKKYGVARARARLIVQMVRRGET